MKRNAKILRAVKRMNRNKNHLAQYIARSQREGKARYKVMYF